MVVELTYQIEVDLTIRITQDFCDGSMIPARFAIYLLDARKFSKNVRVLLYLFNPKRESVLLLLLLMVYFVCVCTCAHMPMYPGMNVEVRGQLFQWFSHFNLVTFCYFVLR